MRAAAVRTSSFVLSTALLVAVASAACGSSGGGVTVSSAPEADDPNSGGSGTNFDTTRDAFNKPLANLTGPETARRLLPRERNLQSRLGHGPRLGGRLRRPGPALQREQLLRLPLQGRRQPPGGSPTRS